ncbi:hypothetical protein ZIOFF_046034 [Zingiber officinale]|uniref:Uncharacterized protein n=1 Tax=Zingiber officinale TaxID=94328 RepID=A0A8J5FYC0_ZINOF|nr:hypothetical protein ZIOFF_046034 [Zingiber officinale]
MFFPTFVFSPSSATNRLITAKDHASIQINIGHLDDNGVYTGQYTTFALSGFIRAQNLSIAARKSHGEERELWSRGEDKRKVTVTSEERELWSLGEDKLVERGKGTWKSGVLSGPDCDELPYKKIPESGSMKREHQGDCRYGGAVEGGEQEKVRSSDMADGFEKDQVLQLAFLIVVLDDGCGDLGCVSSAGGSSRHAGGWICLVHALLACAEAVQ